MNSWEDLARSQGDHCTPPNTLHLGERSFTLPLPLLVPLLVPLLLLLLLLPRLLLPPPLWLLVLSLLLRLLLPVGRTNPYCYCCRCCGFAFMVKPIGKTARPRKSTHIALMTEFWRERFSRCRRFVSNLSSRLRLRLVMSHTAFVGFKLGAPKRTQQDTGGHRSPREPICAKGTPTR